MYTAFVCKLYFNKVVLKNNSSDSGYILKVELLEREISWQIGNGNKGKRGAENNIKKFGLSNWNIGVGINRDWKKQVPGDD